jgi:hypothetical protein
MINRQTLAEQTAAHFTVNFEFIAWRIIRWVKAVAHGVVDLKQAACLAEFDPGESIMPPKGND